MTDVPFDEAPRLPPGHVERRAVSNEVLAFQIQSLQETVIAGQALAREQLRDGFADVTKRLDKHDEHIAQIREQMVRVDARTVALEGFKQEMEAAELASTRQNVLELATARDGALNDRMSSFIARIAIASLSASGVVIGIIAATGGFK